jgi:hypothetical protein
MASPEFGQEKPKFWDRFLRWTAILLAAGIAIGVIVESVKLGALGK